MEYTIVCPIVVVLAIGAFLLHVLVLVCCVCSLSIQDFRMNCMFTVLCPFPVPHDVVNLVQDSREMQNAKCILQNHFNTVLLI